ncbi:MAG: glutamate racemase, partial [Verrucomicrobiota bacterium]
GVFDSGIGGLSVVREMDVRGIRNPLLYVADQANTPYGYLSQQEVRDFSDGITEFLKTRGAEFIVIACNTASAAALYHLRSQYPETVFVGMEPAVKPATEKTTTDHIAVLATSITFQGELYNNLIERYAANIQVETVACPELVESVERGEINAPSTHKRLERIIEPLLSDSVDELVLGCSHFSFLKPVIQDIIGQRAEIIDPADAVAAQVKRVLSSGDKDGHYRYDQTEEEENNISKKEDLFYTTGNSGSLRKMVTETLTTRDSIRVGNIHWETIPNLNHSPVGRSNCRASTLLEDTCRGIP